MEYQITVSEYELKTLMDLVSTQLIKERKNFKIFVKEGRDTAVELQATTCNALYLLLGKLTINIVSGGRE